MKFRFKPDDFRFVRFPGVDDYEDCLNCSIKANLLLEQWEKQLPVVWGYKNSLGDWAYKNEPNSNLYTHKARLWGIEEIEK